MTDLGSKGKQKFVLTIDGTAGLTIEELTGAMSKVAGQISSGRASITQGIVRGKDGHVIGSYKWEDNS
jgi:hypothetical protein